jgi:hypothetical protein
MQGTIVSMAAGCPRILRDKALAMSFGQLWVRSGEIFELKGKKLKVLRFDYGTEIALKRAPQGL